MRKKFQKGQKQGWKGGDTREHLILLMTNTRWLNYISAYLTWPMGL